MSVSPDASTPPPLHFAAATDPGKREVNEDCHGCYEDERMFIVADGMGGHNAGDVASRMAVDEFSAFFRSFHADPKQVWPFPVDRTLSLGANLMRIGTKVANAKIRAAAEANASLRRMGCTMVALAVGDSQITVAHVGDARAYRIRGGELKRLTRDHSIVEEVKAARPDMTEEEIATIASRNMVTKALGTKDEVSATLYLNTFEVGDTYLLCCDGLWNCIPDKGIAAIVTATSDLNEACRLLVDAAKQGGGSDNITVILVRVG